MMDQKMQTAMIAMSGGVDSSVAALLMTQSGYRCIGVTMKLHGTGKNADAGNSCCTTQDIEDARNVADSLGMPFEVVDFSGCFEEAVIRRFVEAYENGSTPNPCVDCNRYLKFEKLFHYALEKGCDAVATGHYARVEYSPSTGRYLLKKALDPNKDQSYVLWSLRQEQLQHVRFPLGSMTKSEARKLAEENGFINAGKRDSQDICFVPNGKYAEFVEEYTQKSYPAGDFLSTDGKVLGRHKGIIRYTIGQKKGLGLVLPEPLYVCRVDPVSNTVTLGRSETLFSDTLTASDINLISLPEIPSPMRVKAKVRYRQTEEWATVTQIDEDHIRVVFDQPQRAITKGQSVVLYDSDVVVGGGIIQ